MRLSRGTSLPTSTVARQAKSWVAVTAEQGWQHLSTDSQTKYGQRLPLTLRVSLVLSEVVGWWPSENFGAVRTSNPGVRTARLADLRVP